MPVEEFEDQARNDPDKHPPPYPMDMLTSRIDEPPQQLLLDLWSQTGGLSRG
jgi:hypothetical protein